MRNLFEAHRLRSVDKERMEFEKAKINRCYSQEGEERIFDRIFSGTSMGFYVDCGANHPIRFSNTYKLYQKGWNGIVIDALPGTKELYNKFRPRDIVVETGLGNCSGDTKLTYWSFKENALNTFDKDSAEKTIEKGFELVSKTEIPICSLKSVLDNNLPKEQAIELFDIDVEGFDFDVLQSNDWNKYRPRVISIEIDGALSLKEICNHEISIYLDKCGYDLRCRLWNTCIFVQQESR